MTKINTFRTLEESILLLQEEAKKKPLSILEILHILSGKGRPVILIILSLPFCQPVQIPGLSIPFGIAISLIGLRLAFNKKVWLPKKLLSKNVPPYTLEKITAKTLTLVRKLKRWIHPRLNWACHSLIMEKTNSIMIFILGFVLALPLPIPLSNLTAAWSIFLIEIGMLEDDGLFVLIGYAIFILTVILFAILTMTVKHVL